MADLDDRPAVPPMDEGADVRFGFFVAGALLVIGGFGILGALNVALHRMAGSSGIALGPFRIYPGFGPFAEMTLALGIFAGVVGLALVYFGWNSPKGRFVLPGQPY